MKTRKIGSVEFSPITMGCMAVADPSAWGPQDEAETIRTMHAARDMGITSFDTAPGYGNGYSEQLLGKAFDGSHDVIIASKVAGKNMSYEACVEGCETSLRYLKRDYIDLYQIHWPSTSVAYEETARALTHLKEQGKIREIGVCNYGVKQLAEMMSFCDVKSEQLMYNLFFRAVEFEMEDIIKEKKLGLLTYSSIAQGLLTGKYDTLDQVPATLRRTRHYPCTMVEKSPHGEAGCRAEVEKALAELKEFCADNSMTVAQAALAWLLSKEVVTTVIAGARSVSQVEKNVVAMNTALTPNQIAQLDAISENIKQKMGKNLDPWRNEGGPAPVRIW